uniref:NIPA like domain containing 2 n=1 Tax=Amphilophus citrinellus TaxID=61819 RepID=A0A3Q0R0C7_AMPCI
MQTLKMINMIIILRHQHFFFFAFVGVSMVFPNLCVTNSVFKYAHVRQAQRGSKPYYTSAMWWCGVVLMGVGELGNFAAYGFAPASLIAPLGCVSVIGNCNLSSFCFLASCIIQAFELKMSWTKPDSLASQNKACPGCYRWQLLSANTLNAG